ncbi:hypothetical protein HO543_08265 [Streptococcus suis]|nr:hypothetical protein [Streptococcus suis]NQJ77290.1 hypothetical protein [Streptococcus suis]
MKIVIDFGNIWKALSAIGTDGAVMVSLYLARRDTVNKVKVASSFVMSMNPLDKTVYTNITVTNVGRQEVIITEVGITHAKLSKKRFAFISHIGIFQNNIPVNLKSGDFNNFGCAEKDLKDSLHEKSLSGKNLYGYAVDSLGKVYFSKKFELSDG